MNVPVVISYTLLDRRGKSTEEGQERNNITEWSGMRYEDLVRLAQDHE